MRVVWLTLALGGCSWFAGSGDPAGEVASQDPADKLPKCKPADLKDGVRGEIPFKVGDSLAGWAVGVVEADNAEFIRVGFGKGAETTKVEIAYNEAGAGEWATKDYRLMPAPENTPPEDLLKEVMGKLNAWQGTQSAPFVAKKEGVVDIYQGLPPCGPDGNPQ